MIGSFSCVSTFWGSNCIGESSGIFSTTEFVQDFEIGAFGFSMEARDTQPCIQGLLYTGTSLALTILWVDFGLGVTGVDVA